MSCYLLLFTFFLYTTKFRSHFFRWDMKKFLMPGRDWQWMKKVDKTEWGKQVSPVLSLVFLWSSYFSFITHSLVGHYSWLSCLFSHVYSECYILEVTWVVTLFPPNQWWLFFLVCDEKQNQPKQEEKVAYLEDGLTVDLVYFFLCRDKLIIAYRIFVFIGNREQWKETDSLTREGVRERAWHAASKESRYSFPQEMMLEPFSWFPPLLSSSSSSFIFTCTKFLFFFSQDLLSFFSHVM